MGLLVHPEEHQMKGTTSDPGNHVVDHQSTVRCAPVQTQVFNRIKQLMDDYKGSPRYYGTSRGYALVASKLEAEGFENVEWMIIIHLTEA